MGKGRIILLVLTSLVILIAIKIKQQLYHVPPLPDLPLDQYWGPGTPPETVDKSIRNFKIKFDNERVRSLLTNLDDEQFFTEPLEGVGFEYGFNNNYLKEVLQFWKTKYNFQEREDFLNKYPHFKTNIQGLDIHFIHVKPKADKNVKVYPLLLLHGWPSSVREFYEVIPILTNPKPGYNYVFELVIPSLPGFGYSQAAAKQGMGPGRIAVIMRNLMERLGYEKYIVHGEDWGALVGSHMATLYPNKIIGFHTTNVGGLTELGLIKLFLGSLYPPLVVEKKHESKVYPIYNTFDFLVVEGGYLHIQATKPDTIGAALKSSPISLAVYIIEKYSAWTNRNWIGLPDGGIPKKFSLTNILDNIMIYWSSRSITTSVRIYSEFFNVNEKNLKLEYIPIQVPTAIASFEHELMYTTDWQLRDKYPNIVQKSEFETGGHFAAFEEPELFANDIWKAVSKFQKYENDSGKTEL